MARICIVTPDDLSRTPRVCKEATALALAGHAVRVAYTRSGLGQWRQFDEQLALPEGVRRSVVGWSPQVTGERWRYHYSRLRHRICRALPPWLDALPGLAPRVLGRLYPELARAAASEAADLYIGHYPAGLAAAAGAAKRHGALLGYDSEDLHAHEVPSISARTSAWVVALERRLVPRCSYRSAASAPMAQAFADDYGDPVPTVVRNTFPDPPPTTADIPRVRGGETLALYWYSQTIGGGRGLEWALAALGRVRGSVRLYLRGDVSSAERERLLAQAQGHGCAGQLVFLAPVAPWLLHAHSLQFDIGLALELSESSSRDLTVANKFYQYLQATLVPLASQTTGQRLELEQIGMLDLSLQNGDIAGLAARIQRLHDDPAWLAACRQRAQAAARGHCAHVHDQRRLQAAVMACLDSRGTPLQ